MDQTIGAVLITPALQSRWTDMGSRTTSRQPDPAETPPSPEDGKADARGSAGVAGTATPVPRPRTELPPPVIDLGVEPAGGRIAGFLLFAGAVVTVLAAAVAYADPGPVTIGFGLLLAAVILVTWRLRGRRPVTTATATGSRLEIVRGGGRHVFDLATTQSPVDVIGLPGDRGWRVLFYRRGMAPYVVDASMVDPAEFMRVLHAHRPEVHYRPR